MSSDDIEAAEKEASAPDNNIGSDEEAVATKPDNADSEENDDQIGEGYRDEGRGKSSGKLSRLRNNQVGKFIGKNKLIAGAGGGLILVIGVIIIMFLAGSAKIIHLAENITVWNMARTARTFRQSVSQQTADSIEVAAADETVAGGRFAALKTRFGETKLASAIEKINSYRPAKVLGNLNSGVIPVFKDGGPRKLGNSILGNKKIFTGWDINGTFVEKTDPSILHPIQTYKDKIRFSAEMDALLEKEYRSTNSLVRGKVLKNFLSERGIKLRWWEKKGTLYKKLKQAAAEYLEQKAAYEKSNPTTKKAPTCAVSTTCDASDDSIKASKEALDDPKNAEIGAREIDDKVATAAGESVLKAKITTGVASVVTKTSAIYGIALPLCLIYDGSVNNTGNDIDNAESSLEQEYFTVRTAADQQKAGDTTAEAVGGLNGKIGSITTSIPQRRSFGETLDSAQETDAISQPQSSATGTYSMYDAFLGGVGFIPPTVIKVLDKVSDKACPVITDLRSGLVLTAAEIAVALLLPGGGEAETGAKSGLRLVMENISRSFTEKGALRFALAGARKTVRALPKILYKIGLQTGAIYGATEYAKFAVIKHMNAQNNGLATDEAFANQSDMGGNLYANENNRQLLYGAPLTTPEVALSNESDLAYLNSQNAQKSFSERYFAVSSSSSLISQIGNKAASLFNSSGLPLAKLFSATLANIRGLQSSFSSIFTPRARAIADSATVTGAGPYNIVQFGWTKEEEDLINSYTNPDYNPIENKLILEQSGKTEEIEKKYGHCFTDSMGTLLSNGDIKRETDGKVIENDGKCSPSDLGLHNKDYGDLVFRWRLNKRNENVLDQLIAIQEPETDNQSPAPSPQPTGSSIVGDPYTSSVDIACATGTNDLGIQDAYHEGVLIKMRLCALPNLPSGSGESAPGNQYYIADANGMGIVNSRVSGAWLALINDAKDAGITLSASSTFRTMAHQQALCAANSLCSGNPPKYTAVAQPGNSPHQAGVAIDFANMGGSASSGRTCATRQTWDSDAWRWLRDNASRYGFKQYANEAWHWDASTMSNRCS